MTRCLSTVIWLALSGAFAGCVAPVATDAYIADYRIAHQLERDNHPTEAAAAYAKAAAVASRPRTKWQAAYRQARQLEISGEREKALNLYLEIANTDPGGEMASRCLYYAGRMAFEDGDLDTGLERMRRVMGEYHYKGLAPQAVRRSVQNLKENRGVEAAIEFLRVEDQRLTGTDVGDAILYHWARLEEERGDWQKALERYERLGELYTYPHSSLYDDAMYEAGQLALDHGEPKRALGYLEALVTWREDSIPTGTYYTAWTDDSQLLVGKIHLEHLNDPRAAAKAFEVLSTFPDSTLADDGLWWAAKAYFDLGNTRKACTSLRRLLEEFEYSNKQRQARERFRKAGCQ